MNGMTCGHCKICDGAKIMTDQDGNIGTKSCRVCGAPLYDLDVVLVDRAVFKKMVSVLDMVVASHKHHYEVPFSDEDVAVSAEEALKEVGKTKI